MYNGAITTPKTVATPTIVGSPVFMASAIKTTAKAVKADTVIEVRPLRSFL